MPIIFPLIFPWYLNLKFNLILTEARDMIFSDLFNLFFTFQFSRISRLACFTYNAIVVANVTPAPYLWQARQSIAYVAAEFIERSTRRMSLKAIDFSPTSAVASSLLLLFYDLPMTLHSLYNKCLNNVH